MLPFCFFYKQNQCYNYAVFNVTDDFSCDPYYKLISNVLHVAKVQKSIASSWVNGA